MAFWFHIARSSLGRLITGWIFAHMNFAIPVNRLRETNTLIAFHHPKPSYPLHILLVPKKAIGSLSDLTPTPFSPDHGVSNGNRLNGFVAMISEGV